MEGAYRSPEELHAQLLRPAGVGGVVAVIAVRPSRRRAAHPHPHPNPNPATHLNMQPHSPTKPEAGGPIREPCGVPHMARGVSGAQLLHTRRSARARAAVQAGAVRWRPADTHPDGKARAERGAATAASLASLTPRALRCFAHTLGAPAAARLLLDGMARVSGGGQVEVGGADSVLSFPVQARSL